MGAGPARRVIREDGKIMDTIRRVTWAIVRAPFTRRAWRELAYCALSMVTGAAGFAITLGILIPALVAAGSILGTVAGLLMVIAALRIARLLGALHRRLMSLVLGERVPAPEPFRPGTGLLGRLDRRLRDRDGWRAAGYAVVKLPVAFVQWFAVYAAGVGLADCTYPLVWLLFRNHPAGTRLGPVVALVPTSFGHVAISTWPGTFLVVGMGAGGVLVAVWLARAITAADRWLARALLGPSRVSELERTRALAVEDSAAALRRVERDLHDGAQVRLAAVAMNLGMAQDKAGSADVRELLDAAQAGVTETLADLRRIARGIHPPVLDAGLDHALASLAASSPVPAEVTVGLPERPSPAIEAIAYFCSAELLANAIKHSSADHIDITIMTERPGVLRLRVTDDGTGGADAARGTGLAGLEQRASTVDGSLHVSSPAGGPTTVTVELPLRTHGGGG
jgi:signal transduction histidine kinase